MVRRGPPAKGHKARARKVGGVAVGAGHGKGSAWAARGKATPTSSQPGAEREPAREGAPAREEAPRRPARHDGEDGSASRPHGAKPARAAAPHRATSKSAAGPQASARRRAAARPEEPPALPTKAALRDFLAGAPGRVTKSDIARHFGLTSDQRPALRLLMREMAAEGGAAQAGKRGIIAPSRLPEITPVEITGTDPDGDPIARPVSWQGEGRPPIVYMHPEPKGQPALTAGERVLARLRMIGPGKYEGRTFKRIGGAPPARILGVFEEGRIIPTDRRQRGTWQVPPGEEMGAKPGEIVLAEPLPSTRHFGPKPARITERLGVMGEPRSVSLVCIHAHGIPDVFPAEAVQQAERARGVTARGRTDLRDIPLVTIDGEDARDFDDAVFAEPHEGGWRILVAIADVAHYVTPASALDREAWARGNSVYFPDRVVPMLPEALSNGWCSLRPREDRGCLFVDMRFDGEGRKTSHEFGRGIMRSAARLTYEELQQAADAGREAAGLADGHVGRLYGAFRALFAARVRRGTLDLDVPERKVVLDDRGRVLAVTPRPRLDAHRLIEEFMVAANVCAAEELERLGQPCMYRVHDRPSDQKMEGLRQFLGTFGVNLPPSDRLHPRDFAHVLEKVRGEPHERLVNEAVLRGQSQAAYAPDNLGHFGLALPRYAHFTSPIRRYADLLVHRALIRGLRLGKDGLEETEAARFPDTGEHITSTERRAAAAERDAVDRYLAAFMAGRVGESFDARISGVTRFGLFVTLDENGASGIVPLGSLPDDRWDLDEATQTLAGRRTRLTFTLGQAVEARLAEATPRTGGMVFHLMQGLPARGRPAPKGRQRGRRG
ncbi:ribonuclease R [Roseomonas sp. PWR1]|uniref:Ribonuclease R n=1 Tax=Roseomonas nitratireducens TaxID=2820810 RepID=A0ABS4APJ9_9PROT|nr:ribonuclease R [Neoroseomonas nitratireducens]MBP0463280.1 ribonuclease R [Neoroseomonas nitratireducens]